MSQPVAGVAPFVGDAPGAELGTSNQNPNVTPPCLLRGDGSWRAVGGSEYNNNPISFCRPPRAYPALLYPRQKKKKTVVDHRPTMFLKSPVAWPLYDRLRRKTFETVVEKKPNCVGARRMGSALANSHGQARPAPTRRSENCPTCLTSAPGDSPLAGLAVGFPRPTTRKKTKEKKTPGGPCRKRGHCCPPLPFLFFRNKKKQNKIKKNPLLVLVETVRSTSSTGKIISSG